jgi:hypothetical protein
VNLGPVALHASNRNEVENKTIIFFNIYKILV